MEEHRDNSGRLSIQLDPKASTGRFAAFSAALEKLSGAAPAEKLDGLDQRFWDFRMGELTVVLHMDTFAGISVHAKDGTCDDRLRDTAQGISETLGST